MFIIFCPAYPRVYDTMKKMHVDMSICNLPAGVTVSCCLWVFCTKSLPSSHVDCSNSFTNICIRLEIESEHERGMLTKFKIWKEDGEREGQMQENERKNASVS